MPITSGTAETNGTSLTNNAQTIRICDDESSASLHYRGRDLLLVSFLLFTPLLTISIVLVAFIFWTSTHVVFPNNGSHFLPANLSRISKDSYYTRISPAKVVLVSSWASDASFFVIPSFMILCSYLVARDIVLHRATTDNIDNPPEVEAVLHGLLKGVSREVWTWLKIFFHKKRATKDTELRGVHVAAFGMIMTLTFAILLIISENWLHIAVSSLSLPAYEPPWRPDGWWDQRDEGPLNMMYAGSFVPADECNTTLTSPQVDPLTNSDFYPCSLNSSGELVNVDAPRITFATLGLGISDLTSDFNLLDATRLLSKIINGSGSGIQVINHVDPKTNLSHALLFSGMAAIQYNRGPTKNWGVDFAANTTSMVTTCESVTQACGLYNATQQKGHSVPFNCSSTFSGDLSVAPADGMEQPRGWDSMFYTISNETPKNVSLASQLNPFLFSTAVTVISSTLTELAALGNPDIASGAIIDAGQERVAFALSCTATVYDVQYSLINGSIVVFEASPSDPRKASIIKAPLQVGFGRYHLFESASLAMLRSDDTINNIMAVSFSQVGMALASGAFNLSMNFQQRVRYDRVVTKVPKGPLWFLVIICFTHTGLALVVAGCALFLRRNPRYFDVQRRLLPRERVVSKKLFKTTWAKGSLLLPLAKFLQDIGLPKLVSPIFKACKNIYKSVT